jgi:hypothetical protein
MVSTADAVVVVWDDRNPNLRRVLASVERKGIPVHLIGGPARVRARRVRAPEPPSPGLPD